jgi:hypothetical protein
VNERERRIGENEALFRSVNEQVQGLTDTLTVAAERVRAVCECGAQSCIEHIELHPQEYEQIRADPTLFVIKPGHEFTEVEEVANRNDRYWLVRKDPGGPAALARATDPRS